MRVVIRDAAPRELPERVRALVDAVLAEAGAAVQVTVEVVDAIEREPGHAAKVKLVCSEVPGPAA